MTPKKERPKIKNCLFRNAEGKCCNPEIKPSAELSPAYRKRIESYMRRHPFATRDDMEIGKPCPINPEFTAFFDDGSSYANQLRCHEFAPKR